MAKELTNQTVTLLYLTAADSRRVNLRFQDIRQVGIYKGMYCTNPSLLNVSLSAGICEISDGDYQVRVETTSATTGITAVVGEYLVLRWDYTGDEDDDVLNAYSVATPAANDIVLALVGGSSGSLTFDYGDATYPRTQPNTLDLHLKVESTGATEKYVRVRAGRIQTGEAVVEIPDQKILLDACPANSRIDLIYVTAAGLITTVKGTAAASPTVPDYDGRRVLAEVTLTTGYTSIPQTSINDVREFIGIKQVQTPTADYDVANKKYVDEKEDVIATQALAGLFGSWTNKDSLSATLAGNISGGSANNYTAQCDGFVTAWALNASQTRGYVYMKVNGAVSFTFMGLDANNAGGGQLGLRFPVKKGDSFYVTTEGTSDAWSIWWIPFGTGALVKQ